MDYTIILLSLIIILQLITLFLVLKPYINSRFERMNDKKLLNMVLAEIKKGEKVTVSYIQRKFRVGFAKASRIVDLLVENNLIRK